MCRFDTSGYINDDDDHLISVFSVETSIGKAGFVGAINQKLWCKTHIETLSSAIGIGVMKERSHLRGLASEMLDEDDVKQSAATQHHSYFFSNISLGLVIIAEEIGRTTCPFGALMAALSAH